MGAMRAAGSEPPSAEVDWLAPLTTLVERAAKNAGMPGRRRPRPGFDGDALIWSWRKYIGSESVAADVRLRAWDDEASRLLHTTTVALAWPVETELRHLSRRVGYWGEDVDIDEVTHPEAGRMSLSFADRLSKRLSSAWQSAERAAQDVLAEIMRDLPNDRMLAEASADRMPEPEVKAALRESIKAERESLIEPRLTPRENEILGDLGRGLSDREIGERLRIKPRTVQTHINNILAKTPFSDRHQLIRWAAQRG